MHALNIAAPSDPIPARMPPVGGIEWDDYEGRDITAAEMVAQMRDTGFQATAVAEACEIIQEMVMLHSSLCVLHLTVCSFRSNRC